jgi:hypothetical protein
MRFLLAEIGTIFDADSEGLAPSVPNSQGVSAALRHRNPRQGRLRRKMERPEPIPPNRLLSAGIS